MPRGRSNQVDKIGPPYTSVFNLVYLASFNKPLGLILNDGQSECDATILKLSTLFCAKQYFTGTATYSYMCETADFYKCFSEYKYLFIY